MASGLRLYSGEPPMEDPAVPVEDPMMGGSVMPPISTETIVGTDPSIFEAGMVDKTVARYLDAGSHCKNCTHFLEPGSCEVVAGPIDPEAVCMLFTPDGMLQSVGAPTLAEETPTDGITNSPIDNA